VRKLSDGKKSKFHGSEGTKKKVGGKWDRALSKKTRVLNQKKEKCGNCEQTTGAPPTTVLGREKI